MAITQLQILALTKFPLVEPGADLAQLIVAGLADQQLELRDDDVVVVAQKVVSKAENRYVDLRDIEPSARAVELAEKIGKDPRHVELILRESSAVVRHSPGVLIVEHRLGFVMANAGIDASNLPRGADDHSEKVLLLPESPDGFAEQLRNRLVTQSGARVAVIVNDSVGRAWRNGTVGLALGAAGLPALLDRRGERDLFGRTLEVTEVALADQLASAASIVQGEGDEGQPVVVVRGLSLSRQRHAGHNNAAALLRPREKDLFR